MGAACAAPAISQLERVRGFEPLQNAWKAFVLPLHHTRRVGDTGFEPATSRSQTVRANQLRQSPEQVLYWCIYTTTLEPILAKIADSDEPAASRRKAAACLAEKRSLQF